MTGNKSERKKEERRRKKKECEQRRRDKLRLDPVAHEAAKAKERERWKKRRQEKKVKGIDDMTPREKRIQRSTWRQQYKKQQENKKRQESALRIAAENSPPSSDDELDDSVHDSGPSMQATPPTSGSATPSSFESRQKIKGHKIRKRNYNLMRRVIEKQQKTIKQLKVKINTLRVSQTRSRIKAMQRERETLPQRIRVGNRENVTCAVRKREVWKFFECDENSRIMSGKKDTITRNRVKKQRRLLSDSMRNLFEKFILLEHPYKISYATFCRLKPFWVLEPNVNKRETCLCSNHENFQFIIDKLHSLKIISEKSSTDVARNVTCSIKYDNCMTRQCDSCSCKLPEINTFEDGPICFKKWIKVSEQRTIAGVVKQVSRVVKRDIQCTKVKLIEEMTNSLPKFLEHSHSWMHQSSAMTELRKNIIENEVLIHMDFSENYLCKYSTEIQSVHFGASRQQITLHTVVTYHRSPTSNEVVTKSFCSLSESLRHDACAVFAHLKGIIARFLLLTPINSVHILTDSPSAQYRNKKMFYLFFNHLVKHFNFQKASWHYHEAGHGKGAPDGIGAYVKRTADRLVALGNDVNNLETLYQCLTAVETKVDVFLVTEEEICAVDQLLSLPESSKLKPVKHTMRAHQVYWEILKSDTIYLRRLSCLSCQNECLHFGLGNHVYKSQNVEAETPLTACDQERDDQYSPELFLNRRRRRVLLLSSDDESVGEHISHLSRTENQVNSLHDDEQLSPERMGSSQPIESAPRTKTVFDDDTDDDNFNIF